MIAWGGEIYNGPVSWDPSTWGTGTFTGGSGDSSGVFVPLADTIAAAAQAPSWLAPADYVSNGYTPEGVSTSIAPSNPYGGYSQAPAFLSPNDYFANGFSPSGANLNASPNIFQSFGGLASNAQGSAINPYLQRQSQLSTNPDPKEAFNFVSNPYVNKSNSFSGPINNAVQSYLGRPATQAEIQQYSQQLAQNPDSYNTIVENIRTSAEADRAAKTGLQNLIFDPKQGDMTSMWLKASYGQYKPTDESFFSKLTNAVGSAIPYAGLGIMTGGLGSLAGLEGAATGALAGGVTGAARSGIEGGNFGSNVLTGALLGGATGGALDFLGSSLPATSSVSNLSLEQAGPTYSQLGYTPQAGTTNFELGYNPSGSTNPSYGFTGNNTALNQLTSYDLGQNNLPVNPEGFVRPQDINYFDQMKPGDVQVSSIDPNSYFIKNADQTLSAVTPAGTIQVPVGTENQVLAQASSVTPIDWTKGDIYTADANATAADIQKFTRPIPLGTPNEPYGQGNFLGADKPTNVVGANSDQPYMQQIADTKSGNSPYSAAIQEGTTFYTDPITGQQIPVELATPQATSSTVSGTGTEGVAQTYAAGPNEYVGLPDGTFIESNTQTGVEKIVDSLPKDAVPINAGNGANPVNGSNTFANLTTGEILSGAGGAAALASLLNSLGVGSGGPGAGANGAGPGTGGGGTGTGGNGTGEGGGGTGAGVGTGTGTGGTGTGKGGGGTGTGKGGVGIPPAALSKLLKKPVLYQSAPGGLYRGNQNPFTFGKDVPIQNPFASYDPFAALNVPQAVPKSDADLLANLLREHIYG